MHAVLVSFYVFMFMFFIDAGYVLAAQLLWYLGYGTIYDVPWYFSWLTNNAFMISSGGDDSNPSGFTPEQWQQIYNLLILEYVIIYLLNQLATTGTLVADSSPSDIESGSSTSEAAKDTVPSSKLAQNGTGASSSSKATMSS